MTQRQRQNVAGLCVAAALVVIGLVVFVGAAGNDDLQDLGGVALGVGGLVAVMCLLGLGRDFLRPPANPQE